MSDTLLKKSAALQANLRLLESQSDVLTDLADMKEIRRFRSELSDFIIAHASAGKLPDNPLDAIRNRLERLADFFSSAELEISRTLKWKKTWIKKVPEASLAELYEATEETKTRLANLQSVAASLRAKLDPSDWVVNAGDMDIHPELQICAIGLRVNSIPNQTKIRKNLRAFVDGQGDFWNQQAEHLNAVGKRVDSLIELHENHQKWLAESESHLKLENFRSAQLLMAQCNSGRFADINYSAVNKKILEQTDFLQRYQDIHDFIDERLKNERAKDLKKEIDFLRSQVRSHKSELGEDALKLLALTEQALYIYCSKHRYDYIWAAIIVAIIAIIIALIVWLFIWLNSILGLVLTIIFVILFFAFIVTLLLIIGG